MKRPASCAVLDCDGMVHPLVAGEPVEGMPNRVYGRAVCDTCQTQYEAWWTEGEEGEVNMLITPGQKRGTE